MKFLSLAWSPGTKFMPGHRTRNSLSAPSNTGPNYSGAWKPPRKRDHDRIPDRPGHRHLNKGFYQMPPRWIKLKEATRYAAIGKERLIRLAVAGAVSGFQDPGSKCRDWIFDRLSLDAYREAQAAHISPRQKALEILNRPA